MSEKTVPSVEDTVASEAANVDVEKIGVDNENKSIDMDAPIPSQSVLVGIITDHMIAIDTKRHQHRLASRFFGRKNFVLLFLPSVLLSMASGILAFLAEAENFDDEKQSALFSLLVGVFSFVSVFLQTLIKELDYGHRSKVHNAMAQELKGTYNDLDLQLNAILNAEDPSDPSRKMSRPTEEVQAIYAETQAVVDRSSTDTEKESTLSFPVPTDIALAYELAYARIRMIVLVEEKELCIEERARSNRIYHHKMRRFLVEMMNDEVFAAFSSERFFPMVLSNSKKVAERAEKRMIKKIPVASKNDALHKKIKDVLVNGNRAEPEIAFESA